MKANIINSKGREYIRQLAREESMKAQREASARAMAMTVLAFQQAGITKKQFNRAIQELVPIMERYKMYREYGCERDGLAEALQSVGVDPAIFGLEDS